MGRKGLLPIDVIVRPNEQRADGLPVLMNVQSHDSFAAAIRNKDAQHDIAGGLRMNYGDNVPFVLMLGGYCDGGYLGTQAGEGIDWVWQHRIADLQQLGL